MALFNSQVRVGIDIGQATTKLVMLKGDEGRCEIVKAALLSNREEGIVSEEELGEHLGVWLREQGVSNQEITLGIQQYLAIAQLSDFPPAKGVQLDDLVALETQQVAGLSDEAFLHDYRQLVPSEHYQNPVLIGVCRESAVWMRLQPLIEKKINIVDATMDGYALALAYEQLVPQEEQRGVHLLLDIGVENTTMSVMENGEPVYVGSFNAGGQSFTNALMRHLSISENEAERTKLASRVNTANLDSPLTMAARAYLGELHNALENWQYQGNHEDDEEEVDPPRIERIYLSGGGARLLGFGEYIGGLFDCEVSTLQTPPTESGEHADAFAVAYGLAYQALMTSSQRISLIPERVRWMAQRRRRVPSLLVALVLFGCLLAGVLTHSFISMQRESELLAQEARKLERSSRLVEELKVLSASVDKTQRLLMPFAARGNRNITFVRAMELLGRYQQRQDWFFFLADEISYRDDEVAQVSNGRVRPGRDAPSFGFGMDAPAATVDAPRLTSEFSPWRQLVAVGFTPVQTENQWSSVRQMVDALNGQEDTIFRGVDTITQQYRSRRDIRLMAEWREVIDMRGFVLRLPLRNTEYSTQSEP